MAEFINPLLQTVAENNNLLFTDTVVEPCPKVRHRDGSGIFTLKGGRYLVSFNGNVSIPTGGTVGAISVALSLNGESLQGGIMTSTPGAVGDVNNVSALIYVDVPCNCCYTLSVRNISTQPIAVDNANLVMVKEI